MNVLSSEWIEYWATEERCCVRPNKPCRFMLDGHWLRKQFVKTGNPTRCVLFDKDLESESNLRWTGTYSLRCKECKDIGAPDSLPILLRNRK